MIQLSKSAVDQLVAIYPEVTLTSDSNGLRFNYIQDYDQSSGSFDGTILSKKQWVVATVLGAALPNYTGQYTVTINETYPFGFLKWNTAEEKYNLTDETWDNAQGAGVGAVIATERAYIEGNNGSSITTYNSPNQNGAYITYNS